MKNRLSAISRRRFSHTRQKARWHSKKTRKFPSAAWRAISNKYQS